MDVSDNKTILVVDDDPSNLEVLKFLLEFFDYKVLSALDGKEAYETFKNNSNKIDVVIADLQMPYLNGKELSKKILEIRADMPIIICSGSDEEVIEKNLKDIGVRKFLIKPFDEKALIDTINKVLTYNWYLTTYFELLAFSGKYFLKRMLPNFL